MTFYCVDLPKCKEIQDKSGSGDSKKLEDVIKVLTKAVLLS